MSFWILTSTMALFVAVLLGVVLMRGRSKTEPAAAYDLRVYRAQLAGVDKDVARGVIGAEDAERLRAEVSRRVLAADAEIQKPKRGVAQPHRFSLIAASVVGLVLIGGALALYSALGAPGYGDLPLSPRMEQAAASHGERPSQRDAEAAMSVASGPEVDPEYNALIKQLRAAVADQPNDIQGHILLAHHEARLGNFRAAAESQARVIDLAGDGVAARDRTDLGELMIAAAGGYVSPEAEQQLNLALQMNPEDGRARYYWGLMRLQTGRPDLAFRVWESTLEQGPPNAPWIIAISGQIEEVARRAGLEYRPPAPVAPAPGPSAEDVAAASELTAQERADMIQGMVEQLSERLTSEGGEPEEWARLIRALGVLGETERAQAAYDESRARFADDPQAEALLITAAEQSGLRP